MATTLKHLIARAILEPSFKKKLLKDFVGTAEAEGVRLSPQQAKAFGKLKLRDWNQIEGVIGDNLIATSACRVK
jgi:hypothetical protein